MRHFSIGQWADYARGLAREEDRSTMEAHLAAGCGRCAALAEAMTRVARASGVERRSEPPEGLVRSVKALLALGRRETAAGPAKVLLPRIFDSALAPAPVGIRGTGDPSRQLIFEEPELSLHLRVEQDDDRDLMLLYGQLVREDGGEVSGVPAYLVAEGDIAAATLTREAGVFELEGRPGAGFEVWMLIDPDRRIAVSLE